MSLRDGDPPMADGFPSQTASNAACLTCSVCHVPVYLSVLPIFRTGGFAWVPRVFVCTVTLQPYILSVMPEACLLFIQFCMLAAVIGVYRISRAGPHNDVMWLQAALLKYSLSLPLDTGVMLLRCLDAAAVASDGTLLLSLAFALHKIPLAIRAIVHSVFSGQLEKIREAIKSKGKCNVICIRKAKISHRNTPSNMDSANGGGGIAIIGTEGNVRRLTGNVLHVGHIYWARGRNMSRGHLRVSDVTPLAEEESSIDKSEPLVDHVLTQLSGGRNVTMPGFVAQRSPSFKILLDRARSSVGIWRRFSDSCAKRPIQPLLSNKISVDMRLTVDRPFRRNKRLRTQSCPDLRECSSSPVRGRSQVKVSVVLDKANVERVEFSPINAVIRGRSLSCPNQASDVTNTEFDSNCWAAVVNDGYDKQEELSSKRLPNTTPPTLASLGIATLPPVRLPGGPRGLQGQGLTAIIENAELPGMAVYE